MSISIIIPTIGSPSREIITESLNSALESDAKLWSQIIVVDNAKEASFTEFLNQKLGEDSRVEIHSINESMTMAECWNYGLNLVKNDWHLYLHDDDILESKSIDSEHLNDELGFINYGFDVFGDENWTYIPQKPGIEGILENTPKFVSTVLNTKNLREIGCWDNRSGYFLDFLAFIKLHSQFGSRSVKKSAGRYRLHPTNASQKANRNQKYGDHLPHVLEECFKIIKDEKQRKEIIFATCSFTYPNDSLLKKIVSNSSKLFGIKAWLN